MPMPTPLTEAAIGAEGGPDMTVAVLPTADEAAIGAEGGPDMTVAVLPTADGQQDEAGAKHLKAVHDQVLANLANPSPTNTSPIIRINNPYSKKYNKKKPNAEEDDDDDDDDGDEAEEALDDKIMVELYEKSGWLADKTIEGYNSAAAAFNMFADKKSYPKLHLLTAKQLTGKVSKTVPDIGTMFALFCIFLMNYIIEKPGKRQGKHFKAGSQAQYLSGVKSVLAKKFPKLPYFKDLAHYNNLYRQLKIRARVAAIRRGESPEDKAEGVHHDLLKDVNMQLIKDGRYYDRCVLNALYSAVGRGSEVATWTWDSTKWNPRQQQLEADWRETKTSRNGLMTWHSDARSFHLDMFHSIAAYIITADGMFSNTRERTDDCSEGAFVFPEFADMASPSAKVSQILKSLVDKVDGLTRDHTGHGIRIGSADDMVYHQAFNIVAAISRGNWDFTGECMIFTYWTMKLFVSMAGKMLAGWDDPKQEVYAPSLDQITTQETAGPLKNYLKSLFLPAGISALQEAKLKPFCGVMLATVLMYHEDLCTEFGFHNRLVRNVIDSARTLGIPHADLVKWGAVIKKDWELRNAVGFSESKTPRDDRMQIQLDAVVKENRELRSELKAVMDTQKEMKDMVAKLLTMLESHVSGSPPARGPPPGPPPKRKRSDSLTPTGLPKTTGLPETQVPAPSVYEIMNTAQARKIPDPYISEPFLREERLHRLLFKMVEYRVNHAAPNLGKAIQTKMKSKVGAVLSLLYSNKDNKFFTTELDKGYLFGTSRPDAANEPDNYGKWLVSVKTTCMKVEQNFVVWLVTKHNALALQQGAKPRKLLDGANTAKVIIQGRAEQAYTVGAISSLYEKVKTMQNKIDRSQGN
jgi:hypothetical protein